MKSKKRASPKIPTVQVYETDFGALEFKERIAKPKGRRRRGAVDEHELDRVIFLLFKSGYGMTKDCDW